MKTDRFKGRDWIDPEYSYSREEWETIHAPSPSTAHKAIMAMTMGGRL